MLRLGLGLALASMLAGTVPSELTFSVAPHYSSTVTMTCLTPSLIGGSWSARGPGCSLLAVCARFQGRP